MYLKALIKEQTLCYKMFLVSFYDIYVTIYNVEVFVSE